MGFRIEHRLGVPASCPVIWEVLGDIERWPQWQTLYQQVSGPLRIGAKLDINEVLGGGAPRPLQPLIVDWTPDSLIHWKATSSGGLVKRTRYFEIEKLTEEGSIFSNGELYDGFMTRYISRGRRRLIRQAFNAFGEALRAEVLRRS